MPETRAPLIITMGEPAGVGPELIARLWREREPEDLPTFCVAGTQGAFRALADTIPLQAIKTPDAAGTCFAQALPLLPVGDSGAVVGTLTADTAADTIEAIDTAVDLALSGAVRGIVTAPIHKAHLMGAGFTAPGHTEYLARQAGFADDESVMMLTAQGLRVVPITAHVAFKDVPKTLTHTRILHAARVTAHDLRHRFAVERPRLAVAGLNPHAGENGMLGMEEATHILPAIMELREEDGLDITDPLPADTLFHAEARATYDAVLCMYHDQALIPVKMLDFWGGVNVTLGLPFVRTSPDHGTALTLAGTGKARTDSMLAALRLADQLSRTA